MRLAQKHLAKLHVLHISTSEEVALFLRKFKIEKIVQKTAHNVADLFNINKRGYMKEGYYADLVFVDMNRNHIIQNKDMLDQSGWTP